MSFDVFSLSSRIDFFGTVRIFIIGFKSSGKTTLGKKLAQRLDLDFIDLDDFIERQEGKTIPEIFREAGEESFRNMEWKALREVVKYDNIVVSTGGGVPCHCDNMNLLEKSGSVIYLQVGNDTLVSRLKQSVGHRPVVRGQSEKELQDYIMELRSRCEHHYLRAHFIVDGENAGLEDIILQLKKEKVI